MNKSNDELFYSDAKHFYLHLPINLIQLMIDRILYIVLNKNHIYTLKKQMYLA